MYKELSELWYSSKNEQTKTDAGKRAPEKPTVPQPMPKMGASGGKISSLISSLQSSLGEKPPMPGAKPVLPLKKKPPMPPTNRHVPGGSPAASRPHSSKSELDEVEARFKKEIEAEREKRKALEDEVATLRREVDALKRMNSGTRADSQS